MMNLSKSKVLMKTKKKKKGWVSLVSPKQKKKVIKKVKINVNV